MKQHLSGPTLEDISSIKYGLLRYFKGVINLLNPFVWHKHEISVLCVISTYDFLYIWLDIVANIVDSLSRLNF